MVDWLSFPAPAFTPDGTVISKGDIVSYSIPRGDQSRRANFS
jgi:hypothetical protein